MTLSRRQFLAAAGAIGATALIDACVVEPHRVWVTRLDLPVAGLPPALDGVRIAHITDMHLPANREAADSALGIIAQERPEIVLLSGDILESATWLSDLATFASRARGTVATFATLGNWEYHGGVTPDVAREIYSRAEVQLLVNARVRVALRGASIAIVGIDDPVLGRPDLDAALRNRAADAAEDLIELWMVHAPGYIDSVPRDVARPPALVLAGHTHGGQIRLPAIPAVTPAGSGRFVAGWYRDTVGPLYVSRGVGTTTIRARFLCPPELPIVTLRARSLVLS